MRCYGVPLPGQTVCNRAGRLTRVLWARAFRACASWTSFLLRGPTAPGPPSCAVVVRRAVGTRRKPGRPGSEVGSRTAAASSSGSSSGEPEDGRSIFNPPANVQGFARHSRIAVLRSCSPGDGDAQGAGCATPNVRANRRAAAGRLGPDADNVPRTCGRAKVACRGASG